PTRFGVASSLAISRAMHVVAVACLAGLALVTPLGPIYLAGVAAVAALLVYEQSLVKADDLSQVKRAFDLNGDVGILYLVVLAAAMYAREIDAPGRRRNPRRERRDLRAADAGGAAGARRERRSRHLRLWPPPVARRARRGGCRRTSPAVPGREVRPRR